MASRRRSIGFSRSLEETAHLDDVELIMHWNLRDRHIQSLILALHADVQDGHLWPERVYQSQGRWAIVSDPHVLLPQAQQQ